MSDPDSDLDICQDEFDSLGQQQPPCRSIQHVVSPDASWHRESRSTQGSAFNPPVHSTPKVPNPHVERNYSHPIHSDRGFTPIPHRERDYRPVHNPHAERNYFHPTSQFQTTLPDQYTGETDLDRWLVHFEMISEINKWEGKVKANYMCGALRGEALDAIKRHGR